MRDGRCTVKAMRESRTLAFADGRVARAYQHEGALYVGVCDAFWIHEAVITAKSPLTVQVYRPEGATARYIIHSVDPPVLGAERARLRVELATDPVPAPRCYRYDDGGQIVPFNEASGYRSVLVERTEPWENRKARNVRLTPKERRRRARQGHRGRRGAHRVRAWGLPGVRGQQVMALDAHRMWRRRDGAEAVLYLPAGEPCTAQHHRDMGAYLAGT